jgi:nicotinate-nucleotide--dimethylbenzimidazole phosphoribosyltransferase
MPAAHFPDSQDIQQQVKDRWNFLTKPPGSLGKLEELTARYAAIRGCAFPELKRKGLYIFCADHGVTVEGVSAYPSSITALMVRNFARGGAAINVLCRQFSIEAIVVDCGVNAPPEPGVIDRRIGSGTRNLACEPAMPRIEAELAIANGLGLAEEAVERFDIVGIGEMGIGNTTPATALLCALTDADPLVVAGPGAGLDAAGVERKARVIERALRLHNPDRGDVINVLAALGGYEIATMAGFLIGASRRRLPVVVDGFIATSAAMIARALSSDSIATAFFAHCSAERGHRIMLEQLRAEPLLDLEMRLGEGSAAAIAIAIIEASVRLYREMATFSDLG